MSRTDQARASNDAIKFQSFGSTKLNTSSVFGSHHEYSGPSIERENSPSALQSPIFFG